VNYFKIGVMMMGYGAGNTFPALFVLTFCRNGVYIMIKYRLKALI